MKQRFFFGLIFSVITLYLFGSCTQVELPPEPDSNPKWKATLELTSNPEDSTREAFEEFGIKVTITDENGIPVDRIEVDLIKNGEGPFVDEDEEVVGSIESIVTDKSGEAIFRLLRLTEAGTYNFGVEVANVEESDDPPAITLKNENNLRLVIEPSAINESQSNLKNETDESITLYGNGGEYDVKAEVHLKLRDRFDNTINNVKIDENSSPEVGVDIQGPSFDEQNGVFKYNLTSEESGDVEFLVEINGFEFDEELKFEEWIPESIEVEDLPNSITVSDVLNLNADFLDANEHLVTDFNGTANVYLTNSDYEQGSSKNRVFIRTESGVAKGELVDFELDFSTIDFRSIGDLGDEFRIYIQHGPNENVIAYGFSNQFIINEEEDTSD